MVAILPSLHDEPIPSKKIDCLCTVLTGRTRPSQGFTVVAGNIPLGDGTSRDVRLAINDKCPYHSAALRPVAAVTLVDASEPVRPRSCPTCHDITTASPVCFDPWHRPSEVK